MEKVTFKNHADDEVTTEIHDLGARLTELNRMKAARSRRADQYVRISDVNQDREIEAIEAIFRKDQTTPYLQMCIDHVIADGAEDRADALEVIAHRIEREGLYNFAKSKGVLDKRGTAEEFSIQFMTAYNKEIGPRY